VNQNWNEFIFCLQLLFWHFLLLQLFAFFYPFLVVSMSHIFQIITFLLLSFSFFACLFFGSPTNFVVIVHNKIIIIMNRKHKGIGKVLGNNMGTWGEPDGNTLLSPKSFPSSPCHSCLAWMIHHSLMWLPSVPKDYVHYFPTIPWHVSIISCHSLTCVNH
jgi:hypothetical protein